MKRKLILAAAVVLFCTGPSLPPTWTHMVVLPAYFNQDIAFGGHGDNHAGWFARLLQVNDVPPFQTFVALEQDTGTVNAGGNYVGEYKRKEYGADWVINQLHLSKLMIGPPAPIEVTFTTQ